MQKNEHFFKTILWTGFLVGLLDIVAAMVLYYISSQKNPLNILPYIASGVLGKKAFSGDATMIVLGLLLHFAIAYIVTLMFFLVYPRISFLSKNKILTAAITGIIVWTVMNLLVLPLTNAPKISIDLLSALKGIITIVLAIGLPLAIIAHNYYYGKKRLSVAGNS